jgi:hypothetical protein
MTGSLTRPHRVGPKAPRRARAAARAGLGLATAAGGLTLVAVAASAGPAAALRPAASISPLSVTWDQTLPDTGGPVAQSSPNVATLNGGPAVVVGDTTGFVWAFRLSNGQQVPGWPFGTGGVPVSSTPSVAALGANGLDSVFVGTGNATNPLVGGYQAINPTGQGVWFHQVVDTPSDPKPNTAVGASMAVGDLQGQTDVIAPTTGQFTDAFNAVTGALLPTFGRFQGDGDFATPALADLYHNGQTEVVDAADSTMGLADNHQYYDGGILRVLDPAANADQVLPGVTVATPGLRPADGTLPPNDLLPGEECEFLTNQALESSAAVGEFVGSTEKVGIAFGDADYFAGASDTDKVFAVDTSCNLLWQASLNGTTADSPALADALGNGQLQVIEGTNIGNGFSAGSVYVLNGLNGAVDWSAPATGAVIGSITTADLTGQGYQDLLVPTTDGVDIFDGRSGQMVAVLESGEGFQNSPLVTNDPNGTLGITIAGYNGLNQGVIVHFEMAKPAGVSATESGAWPEFHHDPQLTGDAGTAVTVEVPCTAPAHPAGYYMVGSDGGVFNFGNLPFCGSTGNLTLNQPVVAMAVTHSSGGYWLVARDGGVFAFGNANAGLNSLPGLGVTVDDIVGMVPTADGNGYWLVGADGGVFAFGDAGYIGSLPGDHVTTDDIIDIVPTADGRGYWMIGRDGGVFALGDAGSYGSLPGDHVSVDNIVGMVPSADGHGYLLVGADGGTFAFGDAVNYGSLPGDKVSVDDVIGVLGSPDRRGYLLVGADGGVFQFGDATYDGSLPGDHVSVDNIVNVAGVSG